jgi:5'(3')-deoxyribonucleotidase
MNTSSIRKALKIFNTEKKDSIRKITDRLSESFFVSYGTYSAEELRNAINSGSPVIVKNGAKCIFLAGYEADHFLENSGCQVVLKKADNIPAIIVNDELAKEPDRKDDFIIIGKNTWPDITEFRRVLCSLKVGEYFLPPHSIIFNFLDQPEAYRQKKIVSELVGVNANMYEQENYIDNAIHEIGHLFFRTVLTAEEKKNLQNVFKDTRFSGIFNFQWEHSHFEEYFCTLYKWALKALLVNPAFDNIFRHEDPTGYQFIHGVFNRIIQDRIDLDVWEGAKDDVLSFFNPKIDVRSGKIIVPKTKIDLNEVVVPRDVIAENVKVFRDGLSMLSINDRTIPVCNGRISTRGIFSAMSKADDGKATVYVDMDGVVANFEKKFRDMFGVMPDKISGKDVYTQCAKDPHFFRDLEVIEKGRSMVLELKKHFNVKFLTTPMISVKYCKADKIEWVKEHFGNIDVIFSESKGDYAENDLTVLVDDMKHNLKAFSEAGGTPIDFLKYSKDDIVKKIKSIHGIGVDDAPIKRRLFFAAERTEKNPTMAEIEEGNYRKGKLSFSGLNISLENPKGSKRRGVDADGRPWETTMKSHYGYILGSEGNDGDHLDVFIGGSLTSPEVYVINQVNPRSGVFDEHKIMLGFRGEDQAVKGYMENYSKGWKGLGSVVKMSMGEFKDWLKNADTKKPAVK